MLEFARNARPGDFLLRFRRPPQLFQRPLDCASANPEGGCYLLTFNAPGMHFFYLVRAAGNPPLLPAARLFFDTPLQRTFQAGRV